MPSARFCRAVARQLWQRLLASAASSGEPGFLFVDRINRDNNLGYCEHIEATNPCAEQPLPPYGCCCLGSIDLTRFIRDPFQEKAAFDFDRFGKIVEVSIRMLDNVLDVTAWPLEQQHKEAMAKRRVGLGFTGLGDALIMLRLRYDTDEARQMAARISDRARNIGGQLRSGSRRGVASAPHTMSATTSAVPARSERCAASRPVAPWTPA